MKNHLSDVITTKRDSLLSGVCAHKPLKAPFLHDCGCPWAWPSHANVKRENQSHVATLVLFMHSG